MGLRTPTGALCHSAGDRGLRLVAQALGPADSHFVVAPDHDHLGAAATDRHPRRFGPATADAGSSSLHPAYNLSAEEVQSIKNWSLLSGAFLAFLMQVSLPCLFLLLWRSRDVTDAFEDRRRP